MEIDQVRYVLSVAKKQNFSRAAEELFISQPALSLRIMKLEKELGVHLFRRTHQGVVLTDEGELFCKQGARVLEEWDLLKKKMEFLRGVADGKLRLGIGPRVFSNHLFELLVDFLEQNAWMNVSFTSMVGEDIDTAFREETLDVVLDWLPSDEIFSEGAVSFWELIREKQCVLTAKDDPLGALPSCTMQVLRNRPVITGLADSLESKSLVWAARESGVEMSVAYRADDISSVVSLVRAGKGVIIGPWSFANYYDLCAVPIEPRRETALYFLCPRKNADDLRVRRLRNFLLECCKTEKGIRR